MSQVTQPQGSGGRIRSPIATLVSERESPQTLSGPILPEDWVSGTVTSLLRALVSVLLKQRWCGGGMGLLLVPRRPGKQWVKAQIPDN